ncbi:MAG TPA: hypothetical protein VGL89_04560 [Candidatus Koribacter sp.]
MLQERRDWRLRRRRRNTKVSERCALGWKNLAEALHKEVVRHNNLGKKPKLGVRRAKDRLDIHRLGDLSPLVSFVLDDDNVQIVSRAPIYAGSTRFSENGKILAAFVGSVLIVDPDGRMVRFGYTEAAQHLIEPLVPQVH